MARLEARREEIERVVLARVYSVADPTDLGDPVYVDGLQAAADAALSYALQGIEADDAEVPRLPAALLEQARVAAVLGVSLDTVLRRYVAGYALFSDFVAEEAGKDDAFPDDELKRVLRHEAGLLDALLEAVGKEYSREAAIHPRTPEQRRAERVKRLLKGELIEMPELDYDLDGWHLGAIAVGGGVRTAIRELAAEFDQRLVSVCVGGAIWAWLGSEKPPPAAEIARSARSAWPAGARLALGGVGHGIEGWRLTHRQAEAALTVAARGRPSPVLYTEVALLSTALRDNVLSSSLQGMFIEPLRGVRGGGVALRETLSAYFAAGRNASSAAAALGLSRQTITVRLRTVEEVIGRPLGSCAAEMEVALQLDDLVQRSQGAVPASRL